MNFFIKLVRIKILLEFIVVLLSPWENRLLKLYYDLILILIYTGKYLFWHLNHKLLDN